MFTTPISLLERLRQPTDSGWARFVDLYTPLLYSWARGLRLSEADAADLVQDVFVMLVRKLPEFRHDRRHRFRAWLWTVLLNQWRDRWGRRQPMVRADLAELPDREADPAVAFAEADYRAFLVGRALDVMRTDFEPATWKACWEMTVEGRPASDIAAELGLSVASVYAATSRVLRRLRQELQGCLD